MHKALKAVFDEHATPAHCNKREIHNLAVPILTLGTKAQRQVSQYRELLLAAELSDHDHALDGKFERIHQTLGAIDRVMPEFLRVGRSLTQAFTQLERLMAETQRDIAHYEKAEGAAS